MVSNKMGASRGWVDANGLVVIFCGLVVGLIPACSDSTPDRNPPVHAQDDPLLLPEAVDSNPDPHVFETTLDARVAEIALLPGTKTPVWTYNGLLPGPLIRVTRGDRLIVHFTNSLPEPTSIHWHGLRISNAMDGVPDVTQPATQPGGAFTYDFIVPDEGIYWYHPHFDSAAQVGYGLYGALIVDDPNEPAALGEEHVLVLSDIALNPDGSLMDPLSGGDVATLFGREGSTLLVNGKVNPVLRTSAGKRLRWRLINAAKTRYFQVGLDGQSFTRIGGDAGFIASPETLDTILLTPAQRADIVFDVALPPSSEAPVHWLPYDRGFGTAEFRAPETLLTLATDATPQATPPPLPVLRRTIAPIELDTAKLEYLALTENDQNGRIVLGINGVPGSQAAPLTATIGETHVWVVQNTLDWAHPFHLHGFFFQVLSVNGVVPDILEWRDTVDVPVQGTTTLAVRFDERPGMWMFHCHILDHADSGMMGMVDLHE
jgi:FtsP/CotA-like multicopper oxidase with cupredoxin domain